MIWGVTGPIFKFSDTWQLVINTGTTIVTFLMVFLIQNSQNRDNAAIQVKLDELIRASAAQNFYIGIEALTDEEIDDIKKKCEERARQAEGSVGRKLTTRQTPPQACSVGRPKFDHPSRVRKMRIRWACLRISRPHWRSH